MISSRLLRLPTRKRTSGGKRTRPARCLCSKIALPSGSTGLLTLTKSRTCAAWTTTRNSLVKQSIVRTERLMIRQNIAALTPRGWLASAIPSPSRMPMWHRHHRNRRRRRVRTWLLHQPTLWRRDRVLCTWTISISQASVLRRWVRLLLRNSPPTRMPARTPPANTPRVKKHPPLPQRPRRRP